MRAKLRSWALAERSVAYKIVFVTVAFVVAFGLRLALRGDLPSGFPYLTFLPAVILTTFFAGVRAGAVEAVLCGLAAWYYLIAPFNSFYLTSNTALALGFYIVIVATDIALIAVMNGALARLSVERRRSEHLAHSRELMFHELQHRVSNSLQVISSLLQLQRRDVDDPAARAALDTAVARLNIVSRIQRRLHDPDRQSLEFQRFLQEIVPEIVEASGVQDRVRHSFDVAPVPVTQDQAVPLALIATELVSNAIEHALEHRDAVTVSVALRRLPGDRAMLEVADDGAGLPDGFDLAQSRSLGLKIARQFADQLGGALTLETDGGTVGRVVFPLAEPERQGTPHPTAALAGRALAV